MTPEELRIISVLRNHPMLYRLALAWPDLEKEEVGETAAALPGEIIHHWLGVTFSFQDWSTLADVSPRETLRGFDRLRTHGVILPDGGLHPAAVKFFGATLKEAFKLKTKKPPEKTPNQEGE